MRNALKLFLSIAVFELAGAIGSVVTVPAISTWYAGLVKPAANPPSWVFGPVWTMLYALMGVAAFLIWRKGLDRRDAQKALGALLFQLALNVVWSVMFFGFHSPSWALADIIALWFAIVWSMALSYGVSKPATWLLAPYLLWVSFASYLNLMLWMLNR